MQTFRLHTLSLTVFSTLLLTACGGGNSSNATTEKQVQKPEVKQGVKSLKTGTLLEPATAFKTLTAEQIKQASEEIEKNAAGAIGAPKCGVSVQYMHYDTLDAKGQPTDATGAVFVPTGNDPSCQGDRPVVLHAHGTAVQQNFNFAEVGNKTNEAGLRATSMANIFAGQGFIVIAPNYAGYDKSKLNYHPYLNADQQSREMGDALKAGREVLAKLSNTKVKDNGKLFLTGYSQGGHVALATARYFEKIKEPVTAIMPMSGPYAMEAFGDVVFGGNVMLGGTIFAPLMARSYQEQFGNIYQKPSDIFASSNADDVVGMLPTRLDLQKDLIQKGKLPLLALFQNHTGNAELDAVSPANPKFGFGFDKANYLISTPFRVKYLADMKANPDWAIQYFTDIQNGRASSIVPLVASKPEHGLRKALKENDLRSFLPQAPTVLCGGNQDPTVFFDVNTTLTHGIWKGLRGKTPGYQFGMIDMDISNQATRQRDVYATHGLVTVSDNALKTQAAAMQLAFSQDIGALAKNTVAFAMKNGKTEEQAKQLAAQAVAAKYHSTLAPYCMATARTFFQQF
ncbi:hypothetical protein MOMA_04975 [Moraxella macacae 0408225]|uniref:Peptidase S9 prolyl oligopeptidase catalytic domain-containing protein n=1 Tax=Moraxella macacae 0408225 TaxID=1230338 RepID=L2F9K9_9GAMM|nr:prolyl oligopeptidase family serine peptidase [Moraxella macacae]ELA09727.1 hypothetical protein MOMA_04975 [Moraxella macacae 0408225]